MTNKEAKAKIILEALERYIQIDWNFEEVYMKAIMEGLDGIKAFEKGLSEDE